MRPWLLLPWCACVALTAPALPATAAQAVESTLASQRADRLLETRLACLGCHRIEGAGGQIGPDLEGLSARADAQYVRDFIRDPTGQVPGTLMPPQHLGERDLEVLTTYLMTRREGGGQSPATTPVAPPTVSAEERSNGGALYGRHCAACHGPAGDGDGWNAANLPVAPTRHSDAALMSARLDDTLFDAIYAGAFVLDGSPMMPPFGGMLDAEQIQALVRHIRELCECEQPLWGGSR